MHNNKYQNQFAYRTDIGRVRLSNQDQVNIIVNANDDVLMLVADGMGGANSGDYASKLAADSLSESFQKAPLFLSIYAAKLWLQRAVNKANTLIYNTSLSAPQYQGMGTTIVLILIHQNRMAMLSAGDSRAYHLANDSLKQLSEDQSYVEYLKRIGQITAEEAKNRPDKNILMNALGIYPTVSFDSRTFRYNNEPLLLCSDGLFNNLDDKSIERILKSTKSAQDKVLSLIAEANQNGGTDNIAVAYFQRVKDE